MKQTYYLINEHVRMRATEAVVSAPDGYVVQISEPTRSLESNAALWAVLTDVSEQVEWYGRKLPPEAWKHIFTAALEHQDVVPNLAGDGFVVLGLSTSKMGQKKFSMLLELINAFCAERGVVRGDYE